MGVVLGAASAAEPIAAFGVEPHVAGASVGVNLKGLSGGSNLNFDHQRVFVTFVGIFLDGVGTVLVVGVLREDVSLGDGAVVERNFVGSDKTDEGGKGKFHT